MAKRNIQPIKNCQDEKSLKQKYKCEICHRMFGLKNKLKKHVNKIHNEGGMENVANMCNICSKIFKLKSNLKRHFVLVHKGTQGSTDYKCESCGKSFSRVEHLKRHIHTVHDRHKDY